MILYICIFLCILGLIGMGLFDELIHEGLFTISAFCFKCFGIISLFLGIICLTANFNQESDKEKVLQEQKLLQYEIDNQMYYNDIDYGLKELYDEVSEFNSKVVSRRTSNKNIWISNLVADYWEDIPLVEYNNE